MKFYKILTTTTLTILALAFHSYAGLEYVGKYLWEADKVNLSNSGSETETLALANILLTQYDLDVDADLDDSDNTVDTEDDLSFVDKYESSTDGGETGFSSLIPRFRTLLSSRQQPHIFTR